MDGRSGIVLRLLLAVPGLVEPPMGDRCWTLHEGYPNVRENRSVSFRWNWDPTNPSDYTPPFATMDFWLEWWLPAGYFGGNKVLAPVNTRFFLGHRGTRGVLNMVDMPRSLREAAFNRFAAPLPRDPDADSSEIYCYWANQLLRAGGIDLAGNPSVDGAFGNPVLDHDQQLAAKYHDPFARINPASPGPWEYKGSTTPNSLDRDEFRDYASPFMMTYPSQTIPPQTNGSRGRCAAFAPSSVLRIDCTCKQMRQRSRCVGGLQ